jgi:hypothetical protein
MHFTALLCSLILEYHICGESVLNRFYMAFNRIIFMLYVIDILYYTVVGEL